MHLVLRIVMMIALLLPGCFSWALEPFSINYSISEGLPSTNVYSVFQEDNGMIWFTTDVGIVKYNSKTFELFNTDNGLSDNEVFNLIRDSRGRMWTQTVNGKPSFIFHNKIYNEYNSPIAKKVKGTGMVIDMYQDDEQNIYFTFKNGEICIIDKNDSVTKFNNYPASINGVWKDRSLYVLTGEFIYNHNHREEKPTPNISLPYRVYHRSNKTFVSAGNLLFVPQKNTLVKFLELEKTLDIINVVEEGNKLWICTRTGLVLYENKQLINHYFKEQLVSDILKDSEGNYWVTTLNKGVFFVPSFQVNQFLKDKKVNCLGVKDEKELWIGGFENNFYIKNNKGFVNENLDPGWLINKISNIRFFGDTTYIIAKSGLEVRVGNKKIEYQISGNDIMSVPGYKYIATTFTATVKNNDFGAPALTWGTRKTILSKRTNVLCKDKAGNIWMGTNFGLHRYNEKDSVINIGEKYDDLSISIEDLCYDPENELLLVATASKGLVILKGEQFYKKINSLNGLNSNTIHSIKKIATSSYLVGSNNGLNKVELSGDSVNVISYNSNFGIKNRRIKDIELVEDTVYMATDNGMLYFNTSYLGKKNIQPKCIITDVKTAFENNNTINYKNNSISFSYIGISFIDLGDVQYFYKLDNQDKEWISTKETQINYKSLPAGKYRFSVYCVNGFGQKSTVQFVDFEILPPFWQQWWFRILAAAMVIFLFYLISRRRLKKQRLRFEKEKSIIQVERDKAQMEKQMVELEQKALRMQMNPHFIFNALNTIKGYYAEGNFLNASNYISKFSKLLRKLLESEEQVTTLDNELEMLKLYIELTQIRYEGRFEFSITVAENIHEEEILIPNLLLQPLVENAIIYGLSPKTEKGILSIDFVTKDDHLVCTVDDNGIGREAAFRNQKNREYKSMAINITVERLALFDGRSKLEYLDKMENGRSAGTKVTITIPIKKT